MAGPDTDRPVVVVCGGKDCARKRAEEHRLLLGVLGGDVEVVPTSCLDICSGPVAVLDATGDSPVVVEKVRKGKHRRAVVAHLQGADGGKPLRSRQVRGKAARKAAKKARRSLRRRR